jgi:hypothetical protein
MGAIPWPLLAEGEGENSSVWNPGVTPGSFDSVPEDRDEMDDCQPMVLIVPKRPGQAGISTGAQA